ncbi:AaceriABL082Cp [[Ashbya] aceris (nom. inval.)]|nr:AaceriABL082Cp [[Ashbya] aceris (nom. inval.)]
MKYLAEYLPRIGVVLVVIAGEVGEVELRKAGEQRLTVTVNETTEVIELPCKVDPLARPSIRHSEGAFEIRLKALKGAESRRADFTTLAAEDGWGRKELAHAELRCAACDGLLITGEACKRISAMPSEFWTELMDYWHCHKPADESAGAQQYLTKYNALLPADGELLVGDTFVTLGEGLLSEKLRTNDTVVICEACSAPLGVVTRERLLRLHKWNLVQVRSNGVRKRYRQASAVVAGLLSVLNSHAARVVHLRAESGSQLALWVFNVGLDVATPDGLIRCGLKILYTHDVESTMHAPSGRQHIEPMTMPDACFDDFVKHLETTNATLPPRCGKMGNWHISYIGML